MKEKELFSVNGLFDKPETILEAAEKAVGAGYSHFDIHTPYPVKGLPEAMKLKSTTAGYYIFVIAILGGLAVLAFMGWTSAIDYPQVIGGKNYFSLPAYIPITFEIIILTAAISAFIIMFSFLARLPDNSHPLHGSEYMREISGNRFGIVIEKNDPAFEENKVREFLQEIGAVKIIQVYYPESGPSVKQIIFAPRFLIFQLAFAGLTFFITVNIFNRLLEGRPFTNMDFQPKLQAQQLYKTEKLSRFRPVNGSVPRGFVFDKLLLNPENSLNNVANPFIPTKDILEKGKENFNTFCSPCHGFTAKGTDSRLKGLFPIPPDLLGSPVSSWPDSKIYGVITNGQRIMPSYASQVNPEERWMIILYLRALQQASPERGQAKNE
jgi:hypothetical protein